MDLDSGDCARARPLVLVEGRHVELSACNFLARVCRLNKMRRVKMSVRARAYAKLAFTNGGRTLEFMCPRGAARARMRARRY